MKVFFHSVAAHFSPSTKHDACMHAGRGGMHACMYAGREGGYMHACWAGKGPDAGSAIKSDERQDAWGQVPGYCERARESGPRGLFTGCRLYRRPRSRFMVNVESYFSIFPKALASEPARADSLSDDFGIRGTLVR